MQSGGERYSLGQADVQAYTGGVGGGGGGSAGGARGLAQLFGHPQSSSDMAGLQGFQLQRPLHQEHQYIDMSQLRGNAPQQAPAPSFLSQQLPSTGNYQMPSFFKTSQASLSGQQQAVADTTSHCFFHMTPGLSTQTDHFKLSTFNSSTQLPHEEDASTSRSLGRHSWRADETGALLKLCSDLDPSSTTTASLWEDVARKLQDMGYQRVPQECKEKFESFSSNYKKAKEDSGHTEHQRRELEFSSDFSSEGGHAVGHAQEGGHGAAAHVQTSDNYDNDDDQEDEPDVQDTENPESSKKRKMGSPERWIPSKSFFKKLSRDIMEKQEALHRAFLETMEKRDRERAAKEEAYRRQEAARLDREQDIRAQEVSIAASRDAALIAFLEKATGQSLAVSFPRIPSLSMQAVAPLSSSAANNSASAAAATIAAALLQQPPDHLLHHQALQDAAEMDNNSDLNTKRWPKMEVHALIRLRSGMEPRFREAGPKAHLWHEIAASMACLGFIRSPKRCKEKWENINKYFKKTKDSSKKRPENAKTCPYFHQLDTLYQRGILTSSSNSGGGGKLHGKSDTLLEYNTRGEEEDNYDMQSAGNDMPGSNRDQGDNGAEQQDRDKELSSRQVSIVDASQSSIYVSNLYVNTAPMPASGSDAVAMASGLPQQMDKFLHRHHHNEGLNMNAGGEKSLHMKMFIKDILDLQQHHHQKLMDEYDRMEQAHELRELERHQIKPDATAAGHGHANAHDNATLMALVHKLAGDSSDLSMSAPSTME